MNECVLQFSVQEEDSDLSIRTPTNTKLKDSSKQHQIVSVTWSKTRKGLLATLSSDPTSTVRIWDIVDGNPAVQTNPSTTTTTTGRNWNDGSLLNPFGNRNLPTSCSHSTSPASFPNIVSGGTSNPRKSSNIAPVRGPSPTTNTSSTTTTTAPTTNATREKGIKIPSYTIFKSHVSKPFCKPTQSIISAHIPSLSDGLSSTNSKSTELEYSFDLLSISKDNGNLEFIKSDSFDGEIAFGPRGQIVYSNGIKLRIEFDPPPQINNNNRLTSNDSRNLDSIPMSNQTTNTITGSIRSPMVNNQHGQLPCLDLHHKTDDSFQDLVELRLANKFGRHLIGCQPDRNQNTSAGPLVNDISLVMINRALNGYGPNSAKNEQLVPGDPVLVAFWEWITHSDKLSQQGTGLVNGYDFSFQGVLAVMKGFLPVDHHHHHQPFDLGSSPSMMRKNIHTPPESLGEFLKISKPKSSINHHNIDNNLNPNYVKQNSEYLKALRTFNHSQEIENFTISSDLSDQRQTALYLCGPDYNSSKLEQVLLKYESLGLYGKACAIALFSGNTQRAITCLQRSDDLQLRTLAPPLATHLNTQRNGQARDPIFDQVCRQLSDERTSEPYLRAIFAYCSTGDWHEVIDETGLPLKDRLAVGLRFLSDEEILNWLENTTRNSILSGDLEGILLTGLNHATTLSKNHIKKNYHDDSSSDQNKNKSGFVIEDCQDDHLQGLIGFKLLQTYINRTGDLQTAALATHLIVTPPNHTHHHHHQLRNQIVDRWVNSYRTLLDKSRLFHLRVQFDISRGQRSRQDLSVNTNNNNLLKRTSSSSSTTATGIILPDKHHLQQQGDFARPQLMLRCQHCLEIVSDGQNVLTQISTINNQRNLGLNAMSTHINTSLSSTPSSHLIIPGLIKTNTTPTINTSTTLTSNNNSSAKKNQTGSNLLHSKLTNRCRTCGKGLPKCSICLIPLTINDTRTPSIWAWCHRCRHVGHADHLQLWYSRGNFVCPVSGCDCLCWDPSTITSTITSCSSK
ncbi:hypothetical protein Pst134EB_008347 [Puccinia striiformis f. sp. tritici]|nr:hypothetical protein Pst134EB_008347 [Puccinia striiformis f. sp. tritici]